MKNLDIGTQILTDKNIFESEFNDACLQVIYETKKI